MDAVYVLIHSPLVGPLTWTPVAERLRRQGIEAVVPEPRDTGRGDQPYWKQHAESLRPALEATHRERP